MAQGSRPEKERGGTVWKITKADKRFSDWSYDLLLLALSLALLAFCPGRYAFP